MRSKILRVASILLLSCFSFHAQSQVPENWTQKQLIEPSQLAETINAKKNPASLQEKIIWVDDGARTHDPQNHNLML